jgi:hypothetical protein
VLVWSAARWKEEKEKRIEESSKRDEEVLDGLTERLKGMLVD